MKGRLPQLLALLAAVQIIGGHWIALQAVAWVTMAVDYTQREGSVVVGLQKTFSGAQPCRLCKASQAGHEDDAKGGVVKAMLKLEAVLAQGSVVPPRTASRWVHPVVAYWAEVRTGVPSTPPPLA